MASSAHTSVHTRTRFLRNLGTHCIHGRTAVGISGELLAFENCMYVTCQGFHLYGTQLEYVHPSDCTHALHVSWVCISPLRKCAVYMAIMLHVRVYAIVSACVHTGHLQAACYSVGS